MGLKDNPRQDGWPGQGANIHLFASHIQDLKHKIAAEILVQENLIKLLSFLSLSDAC